MHHQFRSAVVLLLVTVALLPAFGQVRDYGFGAGVGAGVVQGVTDMSGDLSQFYLRGFIRHPIIKAVHGELGFGVGKLGNDDYTTEIVPLEYRLLISPFSFTRWNPYLYGGAGILFTHNTVRPPNANTDYADKEFGVFPVGLGIQIALGGGVMIEGSAGYNFTTGKGLETVQTDKNDAYWNAIAGISFAGESGTADPDKDGLMNKEEKELGTNKDVADTDGDGLNDGDEVKKHNTNPLSADSDADALKDGEEIMTTKTDPNRTDSDEDGLTDGEEVSRANTDPLKPDTDGDGLKDGAEVNTHKTNPGSADSDADGLNDGDEVDRYRTDPLKADTDGGTVNDGTEVGRGSNPLLASDDVSKAPVRVAVGAALVLEGVNFATGKADILPESESVLEKVYNGLADHPEVEVEIQGHTDNTGNRASNMTLSQSRAESVRSWMMAKGIAPGRMTAKGFGPDKPIAPNTTPEGRAKNRRIEFLRTK